MKIGKREQIVILVVAVAAIIMVAHLMVFAPRSKAFTEVERQFQEEVNKVQQASVPRSEEALAVANEATKAYEDQISSLVVTLNLDLDPMYMNFGDEAHEAKLEKTVQLLRQLVNLSDSLRTTRLTFLNDRRSNDAYRVQMGWNIPKQLPSVGVEGALWDNITRIKDLQDQLASQTDPTVKLGTYLGYNQLLTRVGMDPAEVSLWFVYYNQQPVYFSDTKLAESLRMPRMGQQMTFSPTPNDFGTAMSGAHLGMGQPGMMAASSPIPPQYIYMASAASIYKFGVLIPELKKLWISELIWEKRDPNTPITKKQLRDYLEVKLPRDEAILALNKQLQGLIDMAELADRSGILEINQVHLMKFTGIAKATERVPGQVPTPKPTPDAAAMPMGGTGMMFGDPSMMGGPMMGGPMMGGMGGAMAAGPTPVPEESKLGSGTGIEMYFRGNHVSTVQFLFDVTHKPRTYAVDDLYIQAGQDGVLTTSATVEMVYVLKKLVE